VLRSEANVYYTMGKKISYRAKMENRIMTMVTVDVQCNICCKIYKQTQIKEYKPYLTLIQHKDKCPECEQGEAQRATQR